MSQATTESRFLLYWRQVDAALARHRAAAASGSEIRAVWLRAVPPDDAATAIVAQRGMAA